MADPALLTATSAGDVHSNLPQIHDPTPSNHPQSTPISAATQPNGIPFNIPSYRGRTIPHRSPFFGVLRTAYEKADASLVSESLQSWPEKYGHAEPPAILFGPPGTAGTDFTCLPERFLDSDTQRRIEVVRRGARAAGWDVFLASVRATWSGPTISRLHAQTVAGNRHESALIEHLNRGEVTNSWFDVELVSVHDLDGEDVVPEYTHSFNRTRPTMLYSIQDLLIHEELFCTGPTEQTVLHPSPRIHDDKWIHQFWHADVSLSRVECLTAC